MERTAGLTSEEARARLEKYGPNKLPEQRPDSVFIIFLRQFQSPLIYVLLVASALVFLIGEPVDGGIILFVLVFNAVVGAVQEGRAQNTLLALKRFVSTRAVVIRDGREVVVADSEVVPGDLIVLSEGDKVPADATMVVSKGLTIDEASITGESVPVHKVTGHVDSASERSRTEVFKGTHVVAGEGRAVVMATGADTMIGRIAKQIAAIETEIPLKANIRALSRLIIGVVAVVSVLIFSIGVASGKGAVEMFATVVSIAVSVIPEGLPIVMTLVLASGVWRMSKRNALVKRLQAVEALGQARVIAVDKTGTLTKNEMVVQKVYSDGTLYVVSGNGYAPEGEIVCNGALINPDEHATLLRVGRIAALATRARVTRAAGESGDWVVTGDPTQAALLVLSQKLGFDKDELLAASPTVAETLFDYHLKYSASVNETGKTKVLSVAGAPEVVLGLCTKVRHGRVARQLRQKERAALEAAFLSLSSEGLRVVAVAERRTAVDFLRPHDVTALEFVGFVAMKDALRPEVADAMRRTAQAGMRVVMITGDHRATAEAVAREAGMYKEGALVVTGAELDELTDEELSERVGAVSVFARVTPEHKLRIINAFKKRGEIVAMTGDGVNDAPSLVAADLGVSMGHIGTEVAKEASDIVLLDDNFGSIVSAVEEGRGIYKTIKKVVLYLFSTSAGEVLAISVALILGFPLLLLPSHIIWLNFVTDGFLVLALAMDPKEKGLLRGNFERPKKYLIDRLMAVRMIVMAIPMAVGALFVFSLYFESDLAKASTMALTTLAVFQWLNAWNCRSEGLSVFRQNLFENVYLAGATGIVIALQLFLIYHPLMQSLLKTVPLSGVEWLLVIAVALSIIVVEEVRKALSRIAVPRQYTGAINNS